MKAKILEIVDRKHISSNGSCGTSFVELINELNVSAAKLEEMISEMYNDEEIQVREGINGFMVMKNNQIKISSNE